MFVKHYSRSGAYPGFEWSKPFANGILFSSNEPADRSPEQCRRFKISGLGSRDVGTIGVTVAAHSLVEMDDSHLGGVVTGILVRGGTLIMRNCTIKGFANGIVLSGGKLVCHDCTFEDCGVCVLVGDGAKISDATFIGCRAAKCRRFVVAKSDSHVFIDRCKAPPSDELIPGTIRKPSLWLRLCAWARP